MCSTVKTPTPKPVKEKDPIYMRNPWLDGLGIGAEARGRNSLRIDLGSPMRRPTKRLPAGDGGSGSGGGYGGGGVGGRGLGFTGGYTGSDGLSIGRRMA